jgi:PST family polysaccharide transporter
MGYLKSMTFVSVFTFPVLAGLAVLAHEFVVVFLTEKWLPMVLPLIALTPMAMLKSIGTIRGPVLMARGRPDIPLIWNIFYFAPLVAAIYYGTRYGLLGVAVAFTGLYLITFPVIQWITNRQAGVSTMEFLSAIAPTSLATLLLALTALLVRKVTIVVFNFPDLGVLLTSLAVSVAVYIAVLWMVKKQLILELYALVIRKPINNGVEQKTDVGETAVQL